MNDYDYIFEEVPVDEIKDLKDRLLAKYGNNTFIKKRIEIEVCAGNIFRMTNNRKIRIKNITVDAYTKGGYVTKEFVGKYRIRGCNYLNNSWLSENTVVLGKYCYFYDTYIENSLLIGKFNINNGILYDSLLIDDGLIEINNSNIENCKLYNTHLDNFEITGSIVINSLIRDCIIIQSSIMSSVIKNSNISGNVNRSLLCNLRLHNKFKMFDNHVTDQFDIIVIANIGSRRDYTTFIKQRDGIHVNVGCFHGTLDEFKEKLERSHGPDNIYGYNRKIYYNQYKLAVDYVENVWKIIDETKNELGDMWEDIFR